MSTHEKPRLQTLLIASSFNNGDWIVVGKRRTKGSRKRGQVIKQVGELVYYRVWDPIKKALGRNRKAHIDRDGVQRLHRR